VADVWSVTSYKELYRDATTCDRESMLNPDTQRVSYVSKCFENSKGVFVAASDYVKALPDSIAKWLPGPLHALGTDGFGRSETRAKLREFFEVDRHWIAYATLYQLFLRKEIDAATLKKAQKELGINLKQAEAYYV
jgi:pyruvate dehydrogenase E1 component